MALVELKFLIFAQIGIDIAVIVIFILLIRKLRSLNRDSFLNEGLKMYESLLSDAGVMSGQFNEQLTEKKHLIKKLNEKLDEKIMSLKMLLNRADGLLSNHNQHDVFKDDKALFNSKEEEIVKLAEEGRDLENIADTLSISQGEVMLVLDLKKKISQIGNKEQNF